MDGCAEEMRQDNAFSGLNKVQMADSVAGSLSTVTEIVTELHTMLEDYSPAWYSEKQHIRTEQALIELKRLLSSRFRVSPA